jgi:hypothetical protein
MIEFTLRLRKLLFKIEKVFKISHYDKFFITYSNERLFLNNNKINF